VSEESDLTSTDADLDAGGGDQAAEIEAALAEARARLVDVPAGIPRDVAFLPGINGAPQ
jgi:hypothetical protein